MSPHEKPTGRLRFVRKPVVFVEKNQWRSILQQEWQITTGNHKSRTVTTEWRDVPMEET